MKKRHNTAKSPLSVSNLAVLLFALVALPIPCQLLALEPEYLQSETVAPESVHDIRSAFELPDLDEKKRRRPAEILFPELAEKFSEYPFYRDTSLNLNLRSYYLKRDRDEAADSEAWTYGGNLDLTSGWWRDLVQLRGVLYTSQKAYGPSDQDGTLLLREGQEGFTVLGQAHANIKYDEFSASLYRRTFDLPYLNARDNRMAPNTFEAYTLRWDLPEYLTLFASYVDTIKERNRSSFRSMAEQAGATNSEKGVTALGFLYEFDERTSFGMLDLIGHDLFNTYYTEFQHSFDISERHSMQLSLQFTDQRSIGDKLVGEFDTYGFGAKIDYSLSMLVLSLAFTSVEEDASLRSPWGGFPTYSSLIIQDFERAGEDTVVAGLSFDFEAAGIPELSLVLKAAFGDTPDSGSLATPDQEEYDATIDYRFRDSWLEGFWVRGRVARVEQGSTGTSLTDYRLILNHTIAAF